MSSPRPGDSTFSIGKATTGLDGVARYPRKAGTDGIVRTTERVPNYVVQYRSFAKVDGVQYCSSKTSAPFTIT